MSSLSRFAAEDTFRSSKRLDLFFRAKQKVNSRFLPMPANKEPNKVEQAARPRILDLASELPHLNNRPVKMSSRSNDSDLESTGSTIERSSFSSLDGSEADEIDLSNKAKESVEPDLASELPHLNNRPVKMSSRSNDSDLDSTGTIEAYSLDGSEADEIDLSNRDKESSGPDLSSELPRLKHASKVSSRSNDSDLESSSTSGSSSLAGSDVDEAELSDNDIGFSPEHDKLTDQLLTLCKNFADRIYWTDHKGLAKANSELFPEDIDLMDPGLYGCKKLGYIFGKKVEHVLKNCGQNTFLQWLNQELGKKEKSNLNDFFHSEDPVFMNCGDFVFFCLHLAGLVSKERILQCYLGQRKDSSSSNRYYGFDLSKFEDYDITKDNKGQPGDLLIALDENNKVQHILFLLPPRKGVGLWFLVGGRSLRVDRLQDLSDGYPEGKLHFKYCPLNVALKNLG